MNKAMRNAPAELPWHDPPGLLHARENMNVVIVGHVDHGKSTVIGRLLADTHSLPKGKLDRVKESCKRNAKPFEYAFLLDALKDEQAQGITIDTARCFFKTAKRNYIIIDAPGHIEFLKNMVTGASRAEAALLVIDAAEGVRENSRRHGFMLKMLGVRQVAVLVNKMDLIDYDEHKFADIVRQYGEFLQQIGIEPTAYIPVSARQGDNIAVRSSKMNWYTGKTVLEMLDAFEAEQPDDDKPFRLPVQGVYKFTRGGDSRRIVAGTIESGRINVGDEVVFYPAGKKSTVAMIEIFNRPVQISASAGSAIGLTLTEQIYAKRGDIVVLTGQTRPKVTSRIKVNLFWLGREPLTPEKEYYLKIGTDKVGFRLEKIVRVIDASTLETEQKTEINRHDVAECLLQLERTATFDLSHDLAQTGRFVIVDDYEIAGGGIILEDLDDWRGQVRQQVQRRNYKWEKSMISHEEREEKYGHKAALLLVTGPRDVGKKTAAKALEKRLFDAGRVVYFLGIGNLLYGVDADIKRNHTNHREEHLRRLAEVSHLLLEAGAILIVTAVELTQEDLGIIQTVVNYDHIEVVWMGGQVTTDITFGLQIPRFGSGEEAAQIITAHLQKQGIIRSQ